VKVLVGIGICSGEKKKNYLEVFKYVKQALRLFVPEFNLNVDAFMADGATAIREAAREEFEIQSDFCKFHFWKNVRPKIYQNNLVPKLSEKTNIPNLYKEIIEACLKKHNGQISLAPIIKYDIQVLEVLPTLEMYKSYFQIIRPFWKSFVPNFTSISLTII